ncbi:hypothetical protein [Sphingobium sp. HWE2-09]|uniref:hypothetical protein n=1 Tax=Sphingobium sp. HWE2-09 TaxID=3108390 RepID=UPI002DD1C04C|nr:hypothetical protein [Sphingobium sp. HWE2-09]
MARIVCDDIQKLEDDLVKKCPHCEEEIRWFMFALTEVVSLHDHQFDEYGFNPVKLDERRRLYVCSFSCGGEAVFDWKNAEVNDLDVIC